MQSVINQIEILGLVELLSVTVTYFREQIGKNLSTVLAIIMEALNTSMENIMYSIIVTQIVLTFQDRGVQKKFRFWKMGPYCR